MWRSMARVSSIEPPAVDLRPVQRHLVEEGKAGLSDVYAIHTARIESAGSHPLFNHQFLRRLNTIDCLA